MQGFRWWGHTTPLRRWGPYLILCMEHEWTLEEYSNKEVAMIEAELKDWFLSRRFSMERNMAIKKAHLVHLGGPIIPKR